MTKEQTERACEAVYEAITGKCWHGFPAVCYHDDICNKCGDRLYIWKDGALARSNVNPPLSTSLDEWRPLWEAMTPEQLEEHWNHLCDTAAKRRYIWMAEAIDHLEAALRALDLYDEVMK
jgi:hypothetical protein